MIYQFKYDKKVPQQSDHLNLGGTNGKIHIEVNNRYLVKNKKCWIPIMGEFHYSRVSCCDWKRELLKMKAGGITVVSAYVLWIYHEEIEGVFDFQENNDIKKFVQTVGECGMEMILRIGPWVHGEVRNGGFPDWIYKKPCNLRSDDPEYLKYVKIFYQKIQEQVQSYLFYEKGPIVGIQIENELPNDAVHLLTLKKLAMEVGLLVPIYTVTGWNAKYGAEIPEYDVIPVFGGYPEATWETHIHELEPSSHYFFQPSRNDAIIGKDLIESKEEENDVFHMQYELYPFATCELGGGMQVTHHRRPVILGDDVAAIALVKLGCGNNLPGYYMFHGGTNSIGVNSTLQESKASGYPNDVPIRSYDFQAPIGEYGQIRDQYRKLKLQNFFLQHFGESMGKMDAFFQSPDIESQYDNSSLRYSLRTDGTGGYVFINNYQRLRTLKDFSNVQFQIQVDGEELVFPKNGMNVPSNTYCILPYYMDMAGKKLLYATVQPLAKDNNTWFFFAPEGIDSEYVFTDQRFDHITPGMNSMFQMEKQDGTILNIVTLTQKQAEHFYELGDSFYISQGDMYMEDGKPVVYREGNRDLSYYKWEGTAFKKYDMAAESNKVSIGLNQLEYPLIYESDFGETTLSGAGKRNMWEILVLKEETQGLEDIYLQIDYIGDMAQIYVDGILVADDFNKGIPWTVGLKSLMNMGSKLELLICEKLGHNVYMEYGDIEGLELIKIEAIPVYIGKCKESMG